MREFADQNGRIWVGTIQEEAGMDYKGRFYFVFRPDGPDGEGDGDRVSLTDVRWNSKRTAARTLRTMSDVELRRRLRSALGRSA